MRGEERGRRSRSDGTAVCAAPSLAGGGHGDGGGYRSCRNDRGHKRRATNVQHLIDGGTERPREKRPRSRPAPVLTAPPEDGSVPTGDGRRLPLSARRPRATEPRGSDAAIARPPLAESPRSAPPPPRRHWPARGTGRARRAAAGSFGCAAAPSLRPHRARPGRPRPGCRRRCRSPRARSASGAAGGGGRGRGGPRRGRARARSAPLRPPARDDPCRREAGVVRGGAERGAIASCCCRLRCCRYKRASWPRCWLAFGRASIRTSGSFSCTQPSGRSAPSLQRRLGLL